MVNWAKENAAASGLSEAPIRWLVDDCVKFVEREIRRGNHYDAIIMDPPSYGRGPKGEIWKIEDAIHPLVKLCVKLLSQDPLFFLINSYTTGLAPAVLTYMLSTELKSFNGHVDSQEIGLPVTASGLVLPCGASNGGIKINFLNLLKHRYIIQLSKCFRRGEYHEGRKPKETLSLHSVPAYDRSSCGNCICATCYEQEFCDVAAPQGTFSQKKTPVDATRAHIAIKKQEMLTVTCLHSCFLFVRFSFFFGNVIVISVPLPSSLNILSVPPRKV